MTLERTFRIRGATAPVTPPTTRRVELKDPRRLLPGASREAGTGEVALAADALVRVTLANGLVLWTRADDLLAERGRPGGTARGGGDAGLWDLDLSAPTEGRTGTRGTLGLAIAALDCFGVDLKGMTAKALGAWLEERQLGGNPPGLYRCTTPGADLALEPVTSGTATSGAVPPGTDTPDTPPAATIPPGEPIDAAAGPLLLFIHGTGSSCGGSFGALWGPESRLGATVRADWAARYGSRVFAWEHRSLTESPIANALALARALPAAAELHLVTHSRGGLVGELLCLGERDAAADPLRPALLGRLFSADGTLAGQLGLGALTDTERAERDAGYAADRTALAELLAVLDAKRLRVRRYVRTACPANGTTLASGRLDRWLSLLGHLGGLGPLDDALDFLLAVVKERTDPRTLPGLEAMLPGSALTRLLRHPDLTTSADLSVIAGDCEGDSTWGRIKLAVADWFFASDHDLVVNTGSMTGGIRRPPDGARWRRDRGPEVNHFNYFKNSRSLAWLAAGLGRRDGTDGGFEPLPGTAPVPARGRGGTRGAARGERPLAVIVPGILGSSLSADGRLVWPLTAELARGALAQLAPGSGARVEATDLLEERYGPLRDFLSATHRVLVFPYDWRLPLRTSAAELAERLTDPVAAAERARVPVRLIAHGAGGLVVRAMTADGGPGAALWRRIGALPQSRLLLLGTPHQGAWETLRWLTGRHPSLMRLALLDLNHGIAELAAVLAACPGLLELLPNGPADPDLGDPAPWTSLRAALGTGWSLPSAADLKAAQATWAQLRQFPPDPRLTVSVLGDRPVTVAGYRITPAAAAAAPDGAPGGAAAAGGTTRLSFLATRRGDGAVTWASSALPGLPVWYLADTAHDGLCRRARAFPAYLDLLTTGTTTRLPQAPPGAARGGTETEPAADFPLPERPALDAIPDSGEAARIGFGIDPLDADAGASAAPVIQVRVRHGDLGYSRFPVLVGHYAGDSMVGAERVLDERLGRLLEERQRVGLYPGPAGTHAVFFNERRDARPPGALVIGLGQVGALTPGALEAGVRDTLVEYALRVARWPTDAFGPAGTVRSAAVSALLIGSGAGGIGVTDSVKAILRAALAASDRLLAAGCGEQVAIDRLEFLEVQLDLAIGAARALKEALADAELGARFVWPRQVLVTGEGGQRRLGCDEAPEWWQRLEIVQDGPGAAAGEALRFIATTDRARAEVTLAAGQLRLADDFVAQASRNDSANSEAAKTLFEMLLPTRLRELAPQQGDLVLLVDETSARFPWELLEDRWSQNGRPPAVGAGMVRQFKTAAYRARPSHAAEARAFVVGNPSLDGWEGFADLPGARAEAARVAELLRGQGYQVRDSIDEPADSILAGLHKDAWRILHLAGHGEHEYALTPLSPSACAACGQSPPPRPERRSGMLIGKETFLTPGDVEQMRWVPELVFINCCHLGKTLRRTGPNPGPNLAHLAANLAAQFVRMGVRAVVAAGWAVNDTAGLTFAEHFYTRMLAGAPFGEAVRAARAETWQRHPEFNTWGAYQCYGDPAYRLVLLPRQSTPVTRRTYHHADELIADLENLAQSVRMEVRAAGADDPAALADWRTAIETLRAGVPDTEHQRWFARADLAAALGFALAETGDYPQAVEWLDRALSAETGDCPLAAWERCTGLKVLLVRDAWLKLRDTAAGQDGHEPVGHEPVGHEPVGHEPVGHEPVGHEKEVRRQELVGQIESCITELALMCQRAATVERLTALGNACRYLAWLQTGPRERREALINMAAYLERALNKSDQDDSRLYPLWAAARVLSAEDAGAASDWRTRLAEELRAMLDEATRRAEQEPSFANAAAVAENETALLLTAAEVPAGTTERITDLYQAALRGGASPREAAGVREYLDFLIALGERLPTPVQSALVRIRGVL